MPLSLQMMELGQQALAAFKEGDRTRGIELMEKQAFVVSTQLAALTPFEVAMVLAGAGKLYETLGQFELAALKYADAAAYAEIREPGTVETAGDFGDLANMLERIGDPAGALRALQRSAEHLKLAGVWEKYRAGYETRMARLAELDCTNSTAAGTCGNGSEANVFPFELNLTACPQCNVPYSITTFGRQVCEAYPSPEHGEILLITCSECSYLASWIYLGEWDVSASTPLSLPKNELPVIVGADETLLIYSRLDEGMKLRAPTKDDPHPIYLYWEMVATPDCPADLRTKAVERLVNSNDIRALKCFALGLGSKEPFVRKNSATAILRMDCATEELRMKASHSEE